MDSFINILDRQQSSTWKILSILPNEFYNRISRVESILVNEYSVTVVGKEKPQNSSHAKHKAD